MSDTKLTLEDRSKFESLLAEYANAEMDCVRAVGRRHDALHRVLDYVNTRTAQADDGAFHSVPPAPSVPTGTQGETPMPPWSSSMFAIPGDVKAVHDKTRVPVPILGCGCATCCEARALASIGKPAEGMPFVDPPPMGQYSGN